MMIKNFHRSFLLLMLIFASPVLVTDPALANSGENAHASPNGLVWEKWDDKLFDRAKQEQKFVLLDLEAVWCHWCHVMDEKTYGDADVAKLLKKKFILVKVDQDSRPDLSHKYEDFGWPATIIFNANGDELVKRQGYIPPERMQKLLAAIIKDPTPEAASKEDVTFRAESSLSKEIKDELEKKHVDGYDTKSGAWGFQQKFLDWDSVEHSMQLALSGDKDAKARVTGTLDGQLNLLDPVWGGVYQYSTGGDWQHPHYEKIMQMQGENLRIYALGSMLYKDEKYTKAAKSIADYLDKFLTSPDGAFYTSQDADLIPGQHSEDYFGLDDEARRKRGIPRVDKHIYSRENGWAINGFAHIYMATGEPSYLERATRAAESIVKNRSLTGGGYSHDERDNAGPFLGDSLSMGRAFLALYEATADKKWLDRAQGCADFISNHFNNYTGGDKTKAAGYVTADPDSSKVAKPVPLLDENIMLARFSNLLFQYTGKQENQQIAKQCMRYLSTPAVARTRRFMVGGILIADNQISTVPFHITIVGAKKDPRAQELFSTALRSPSVYRRIEWYDKAEGSLPNMDVEYPDLPKAAAFSCGNGVCSTPAYDAAALTTLIEKRSKM
ncbi:MAG: DUF255 domain-containing protein [Candidatus Melainabacteria bacterium]|nr:DUF255 domain-containing protein [Candidatus Melainabacteria bacterium]